MANNKWLETLQKGDRVVVRTGYYGKEIAVIEKITKSQIIVQGKNQKFRRADGGAIGKNSFPITELVELTPEVEREVLKKNLIAEIEKASWGDLSIKQLEQIKEIIKTE